MSRAPSARLSWLVLVGLLALSTFSCSHEPTGIRASSVRVVLITFDGLRPDAISQDDMPNLWRVAKQGAATSHAQTVIPSLTLPSHTSMMTGLIPERHGITWNDDAAGKDSIHVHFPTMFDIAEQSGYVTAMFVGKSKLNAITHDGSPNELSVPPPNKDGSPGIWYATDVSAKVLAYLTQVNAGFKPKPKLMWIHLPDVDLVGHRDGWMSPAYIATVKHVDSVFATIFAGLQQSFGADLVLIASSDHGGHDKGHVDGDVNPISRTTPWIAWGKPVRAGILADSVNETDNAATMLWLIGLTPPAGWDGRPVTGAFPSLIR